MNTELFYEIVGGKLTGYKVQLRNVKEKIKKNIRHRC